MKIEIIFGAQKDWRRLKARLDPLLFGLHECNRAYLREEPLTPPLYESGIKYRVEPLRPRVREQWQDIELTIKRGHGDCEDLAAWRSAELAQAGIAARPIAILSGELPGGVRVMHAVVQLPDGTIEDPSKHLRALEAREVG